MRYTSQDGCLFYYDRVTYSWQLCEPTMLFILGFEAITSYELSPSDKIVITKMIERTDLGIVDEMPNFDRFHEALTFLQSCGQIEDRNTYALYECDGLKLFMNDKTGTGDDRTVPIIFRNDVNDSLVSLNPNDDQTYYDAQAEYISSIFRYAGYNVADNEVPYLKEYLIDKDDPLYQDTLQYNNTLREEHRLKSKYGQVYKLLDYKSMYSYALGVLYGLRSLGFPESLIFRVDPKHWYIDHNFNLVKTAYDTFRFHYSHPIYETDIDPALSELYKGIQKNKLWNYSEIQDEVPLYDDEVYSILLSTSDDGLISEPIILLSKDGENYFIKYDPDNDIWTDPAPLSDILTDGKGIVATDQDPIVRYIGSNTIKVFKPYNNLVSGDNETVTTVSSGSMLEIISYEDQNHVYVKLNDTYGWTTDEYLVASSSSPGFYEAVSDIELYKYRDSINAFIDKLGWIYYDYDSWRKFSSDNAVLTSSAKSYEQLPTSNIGYALDKGTGSFISYYLVPVNSSDSLVGIFPETVLIQDTSYIYPDDKYFSEVISGKEFNERYDILDSDSLSGYEQSIYYNLSEQILLFVNGNVYFNGAEDVPLVYDGYTPTPSEQLNTFIYDVESNDVKAYSIRYNSELGYWTDEVPKEERAWLNPIAVPAFVKLPLTVNIYSNINLLLEDAPIYHPLNSDEDYICNTDYDQFPKGFIEVSNLYSYGLTQHLCPLVDEDDNGNPLVDSDGNKFVWFDPETNLYWNDKEHTWQSTKPMVLGTSVYDANSDSLVPVTDTGYSFLYGDGTEISYSDFYSYPYYNGAIRSEVLVFNPSVNTSYITAYCDFNYNGEIRYCIKSVTDHWVTVDELNSLGFRIVDGSLALYDGDNSISVVYDDDTSN